MFSVRRKGRLAAWFAIAWGLMACTDTPGTDVLGTLPDDVEFSQAVQLSQFQQRVDTRAVRVEIEIVESGDVLVAREVEIEDDRALLDDEEIESPITSIVASGDAGIITLMLGGLEIGFDVNTSFRGLDGLELGLEDFVDLAQALLGDGVPVGVEARRSPVNPPQDPDDAEFMAAELRLLSGSEKEIEINIDRDNLERNDSPPPDGWIHVLGLSIELRVSTGETEIEEARDDLHFVRFEGRVTSVNLDHHAFTLENGTIVRLVEKTEVHFSTDDARLRSLAAVAEALERGLEVFAAGEGVLEDADPRTIVAARVVFRVIPLPIREFEGEVVAVNLDARTFELASGLTVRVGEETHVRHEADANTLPSLEGVARALENEFRVFSHGAGLVESEDPPQLFALKLVWLVELPPLEEFKGKVIEVNLDRQTFTLESGTTVRVSDMTRILFVAESDHHLRSLEAVAEALASDRMVFAAGAGVVEQEDPLVIHALRVVFEIVPPRIEDFGGKIVEVFLDRGAFALEDGTIVRLDDVTHVVFDGTAGTLPGLGAVAEAMGNGVMVFARGFGIIEGEDPLTILARKVQFLFEPPPELVEFAGKVVSVDLDNRSFKLEDGTIIKLPEPHAVGADESALPSLEALADALWNDVVVFAHGVGVVQNEDPLTILAVRVVFRIVVHDEAFEGVIGAMNLDARTFWLKNGLPVHWTDNTVIDAEGDFASFGAVKEALVAGRTVAASGVGKVVRDGEALVFVATMVRFTLIE